MIEQNALEPDHEVSVGSVVAAAENQVSSDVAGQAVILELDGGMYYGLDGIATRIWSLIQQPTSVSTVRDALLDEYEVDADRCEQDLLVLLGQLAANGLITIQNETISTLPAA